MWTSLARLIGSPGAQTFQFFRKVEEDSTDDAGELELELVLSLFGIMAVAMAVAAGVI